MAARTAMLVLPLGSGRLPRSTAAADKGWLRSCCAAGASKGAATTSTEARSAEVGEDPFHILSSEGEDAGDRALDFADLAERGLSRAITTGLTTPVAAHQRTVLIRSEQADYRLFSEAYEFLLYARAAPGAQQSFEIYTVDPTQAGEGAESSVAAVGGAARPAFLLEQRSASSSSSSSSAPRVLPRSRGGAAELKGSAPSSWHLVRAGGCEGCFFSPKRWACGCRGRRQVLAEVQQSAKQSGSGVCKSLEANIPALRPDGTPVVWCPLLDGQGGREALGLATRSPTWSDEFQCFVSDFVGRTVTPSPDNFQLVVSDKPDEMICQYCKIGPMSYGLDFKHPLSVIQAFGLALTTVQFT